MALVEELARSGWLDAAAASWLTGWFGRLAGRRPPDISPVLIHGDIAAQNLMVHPSTGDLTGIVDWATPRSMFRILGAEAQGHDHAPRSCRSGSLKLHQEPSSC
jgi:hypothetical protein